MKQRLNAWGNPILRGENMVSIEIVDIHKVCGDGALKAFADIRIGGTVIARGFSLIKDKRGMHVMMPRKAGKDGKWYDILVPLDEETRLLIENLILEAYDKEVDGV